MEPLITDPPRSGQSLYNGQTLWHGLNLPYLSYIMNLRGADNLPILYNGRSYGTERTSACKFCSSITVPVTFISRMRNRCCIITSNSQSIPTFITKLNKSRRHHGVRYYFHLIYIGLRPIKTIHAGLSCLLFLPSPRRTPCFMESWVSGRMLII